MKNDLKLDRALSFTRHARKDLSTRKIGKFEPTNQKENSNQNDKAFSNAAYALRNIDDDRCKLLINNKFLKQYYP